MSESTTTSIEPIDAAIVPIVNKTGRPSIDWEALYKPAEELAAKGMKSRAQICTRLGVSPLTLTRASDEIKAAFDEAVKRGHAKFTETLLNQFQIRLPKNDSLLMFALKQDYGAGWSDQAVSVQHGGKMELVVRHEVMGLGREQEAIDITPGTAADTKAERAAITTNDNSDMKG